MKPMAYYASNGIDSCMARNRTSRKLPKTMYLIIGVLVIGACLTLLNIYELRRMQSAHLEGVSSLGRNFAPKRPIVWVRAKDANSGYLDHVFDIFGRLGYARGDVDSDWDVLWHHDYPFLSDEMRPLLVNLDSHKKVNHVPGSGYYTSKVSLATSNVTGIPTAFNLPAQKDKFLAYAKLFPDKSWVQKDNRHRGIRVKKVDELDLNEENSFVQEYIAKPLLIDNRKFDIGVYTVITSVQPLRVYTFEGEALLRFCPEDYYPFDPSNLNKYVVHDDYTPVWELPSLKKYYVDHNYNRKQSLNAYLREQGTRGDPQRIWDSVRRTIKDVLHSKKTLFADLVKGYKSPRNFFELSRFDFVMDDNFNVYLMEANMSPNLSSDHFPGNKLLYEQVIYNLLALVGVGRMVHTSSLKERTEEETQMEISVRDLQVYPEICAAADRCSTCGDWKCKLCSQCITEPMRRTLTDAYMEHVNRHNMRRVIPEPLKDDELIDEATFLQRTASLDENDRLMAWWFRGKCQQDRTWCR